MDNRGCCYSNAMETSSRGFTLIELLVTVALLAIVAVLAGPAFRDLILNNRQAAQLNEMMASLNLARAEAVKRGASVRVCITDGATTPDCSSTRTEWELGWLMVADSNRDGTLSTAGGDTLLQVQEAIGSGTTLRGNSNVTRSVSFNSRGFSGSTGSTGTLRLCDARGAGEARGIVIANTGRARRSADSNDNGTEEDGSNVDLACP